MQEQIRFYVEGLFADVPPSGEAEALKYELLDSLLTKYANYIDMGMSEQVAYSKVVNSVGDFEEISRELRSVPYQTGETDLREDYYRRATQRISAERSSFGGYRSLCHIGGRGGRHSFGTWCCYDCLSLLPSPLRWLFWLTPSTEEKKEAPPAQFVQDFQTWRQEHEESEKKTQVFGGAIWLLIVAIYLLVSF